MVQKTVSFNKPTALICVYGLNFRRAIFARSFDYNLQSLYFCTVWDIQGCHRLMYICIHNVDNSSAPLAHKVNVILAVGIVSLVIVYVGYSDDLSEFLQLLEISIHRSEREVGIVAF